MRIHMLLYCLLMCLWVTTTTNQGQLSSNYTFEQYLEEFEKFYDNQTEYQLRKQIFQQNYQLILQLEQQSNGSCHFGLNKFTDWTPQQKQRIKGLDFKLVQQQSFKSSQPIEFGSNDVQLPQELNYLKLKKVTVPKDQESCGSCWAFSSTALFESLLLIFSNYNSDSLNLSEQYTLQCSGGGDCEGGLPGKALQKIVPNGVPPASQFEYRNDDYGYPYNQICGTTNTIKLDKKLDKIGHYENLTDDQLKYLLYRFGPISVAVYSDPLYNYKSGVFSGCPSYSGSILNHAVLLVGYTSEGNWILKNSWGTGWGQNGFFVVSKYRNCGLNVYVDAVQLNTYANEVINAPEQDSSQNQNSKPIQIQYGINLTDTYGDGWNKLILGIFQNNKLVFTFGKNFTKGSSYPTIYTKLKQGVQASVKVVQSGQYNYQIGFVIFDKVSGLSVVTHNPSKFSDNDILGKWLPSTKSNSIVTLSVKLEDTYGDGANDNILGFQQDGQIVQTFGKQFDDGYEYGPVNIKISGGIKTKIVVSQLGEYTSELSFTIKYKGKQIFKWNPNQFTKDTVFGTICPDCLSSFNQEKQRVKPKQTASLQNSEDNDNLNKQEQQLNHQILIYRIVLGISAGLALIFLIGFIIVCRMRAIQIKNREENKVKLEQQSSSNKQIQVSTIPQKQQQVKIQKQN